MEPWMVFVGLVVLVLLGLVLALRSTRLRMRIVAPFLQFFAEAERETEGKGSFSKQEEDKQTREASPDKPSEGEPPKAPPHGISNVGVYITDVEARDISIDKAIGKNITITSDEHTSEEDHD